KAAAAGTVRVRWPGPEAAVRRWREAATTARRDPEHTRARENRRVPPPDSIPSGVCTAAARRVRGRRPAREARGGAFWEADREWQSGGANRQRLRAAQPAPGRSPLQWARTARQ